ncbi:phage head morphogenesis protein [Lysobacter sp. CA199]|uniref:phage head morphogenesis protein n=1 Tax=Lysobacter sp. CA199 TaxID=3455608 RepID=UPI003F8D753A
MVAGANKLDLVDDFRVAIQGAIDSGVTLDDFRKRFDGIVAKHGWEYNGGRNWRSRIIYETNVRQSYNAGRWAQFTSPDMIQVRPFLQYRHNDRGRSQNPRPLHKSWDGIVLRYDAPWWKTHAPQNGWGCNCGIRALSAADLKRMGKSGPDQAPDDGTYAWVAPDGVAHQIPNGIDPGFNTNQGEASRALPAAQRFGQRVMGLPQPWRQRALQDAGKRAADWHADAPPAIGAALAGRLQATGQSYAVGMLRSEVADHLARASSLPSTATIAIADSNLVTMAQQGASASAFPASILRDLPAALAKPDAVFYNAERRSIAYAWSQPGQRAAALTIDLDAADVLDGAAINAIRSGDLLDQAALILSGFVLIFGRL